ncbi:MAG: orotidine 5'-phosphate decarboxylase / HUMPS family protein [Acidimicrobiales bacterium]
MSLLAPRNPDRPTPIVQLCVDVVTIPSAIEVAHMGLRAGVDWLEFGTPLISFAGINSFGEFLSEFPGATTFLDAKVMDASLRYVKTAAKLGIDMVCLCASASDATFRVAVAEGRESGVKIVGDLYAVADPVRRAKELIDVGVDYLYLHYGYDQLNEEPQNDRTLEHLVQIKEFCSLPIGIVASSTAFGEEAARSGADIILVSHPFLIGPEAEDKLSDFVTRVKTAAR